jgi:hypothetical protein
MHALLGGGCSARFYGGRGGGRLGDRPLAGFLPGATADWSAATPAPASVCSTIVSCLVLRWQQLYRILAYTNGVSLRKGVYGTLGRRLQFIAKPFQAPGQR